MLAIVVAAIATRISTRGSPRSDGLVGTRPAQRAEHPEHQALQAGDHPEHDDLGEQVRAAREPDRALAAVDLAFLDQLADRRRRPHQRGADDEHHEQALRRARDAAQLLGQRQAGVDGQGVRQRRQQQRQGHHEDRVLAVGADHRQVAPGEDAELRERRLLTRRRGRGRRGGRGRDAGTGRAPASAGACRCSARPRPSGGTARPSRRRPPASRSRKRSAKSVHAEVGEGLLGRAEVGDGAAGGEDQQPVADVEVGDAVGDDDDGAAVVGEAAQGVHDGLVQSRVEPGGGFVEEEQRRVG